MNKLSGIKKEGRYRNAEQEKNPDSVQQPSDAVKEDRQDQHEDNQAEHAGKKIRKACPYDVHNGRRVWHGGEDCKQFPPLFSQRLFALRPALSSTSQEKMPAQPLPIRRKLCRRPAFE
ncbi:MAG: hypothetical protein LBC55_04785 [Desulfovibrio sp.]|nr:hypothetical protein [Desulfovibrio sp.]